MLLLQERTPSVRDSGIARLRWAALDRALIDGADPSTSAPLAARAARLTSPAYRAGLAEGLERMVRRAHGPQRRWWDLGQRETVLANSSELHALAALLRDAGPVHARGVAMLVRVLSDGTGPAYGRAPEALRSALRDARAAMEG